MSAVSAMNSTASVNLPSLSHVSLARISDHVKATIITVLPMVTRQPARESDAVAGLGAMGNPVTALLVTRTFGVRLDRRPVRLTRLKETAAVVWRGPSQ